MILTDKHIQQCLDSGKVFYYQYHGKTIVNFDQLKVELDKRLKPKQKDKDTQKKKASAMIHPRNLAIDATFTACLVPEGGMKKQTSTTTFSNNKSQKPLNANTATWKIPVAVFFFDKKAVCM